LYRTPQKLAAEFLGTFALIFFGAGAICADQFLHGAGGIGLLGIALAQGLTFGTMLTALGHVSGGHFNPAITIGMWVTRRINTLEAFLYWVAQLAGAVAAAYTLKLAVPQDAWRAVALGTPDLARDLTRVPAMALEALLTFFLVFVFFATTIDEKGASRRAAGFAAGLVISAGILAGSPFTGAAMNPARAFGPALAAGHWANWGVYWVGPLGGGFLAGWLYDALYLRKA
jgi:MIP family channel proteins